MLLYASMRKMVRGRRKGEEEGEVEGGGGMGRRKGEKEGDGGMGRRKEWRKGRRKERRKGKEKEKREVKGEVEERMDRSESIMESLCRP